MDSTMYFFISIILFLLRIGITIYCVNTAGQLSRSKFGWGLFGFIVPLLALIWIQFMKPKYSEEELRDKAVSIQTDGRVFDSTNFSQDNLNIQKNALLKLKEENLLSEVEYKEKLQRVIEKEKEEINLKQEKQFDQLVLKQIEPLIQKLDDLLKSDLLTQEEYEAKKNQLISNKSRQLKEKKADLEQVDDNIGGVALIAILAVFDLMILFLIIGNLLG